MLKGVVTLSVDSLKQTNNHVSVSKRYRIPDPIGGLGRGYFAALCMVVAGCSTQPHATSRLITDPQRSDAHQPCLLERVAELPFRISSNHLVVDSRIEGQPIVLVFDTGAFETILSPITAQRLKLSHRPGYTAPVRGIGGVRATSRYSVHQFQLGSIHGIELHFLVADLGMDRFKPTPDGTLGADILWNYDVDLDIPERKVILYYPRHDCSAPSAFLSGPLYQVPLVKPRKRRFPRDTPPFLKTLLASYPPAQASPRVEVSTGGKTLIAAIDTGAPSTMLFANGARKLGVTSRDTSSDPHGMAGGVGPRLVTALRHVMASVAIGDLEIDNVRATLVAETGPDDVDMLLGLDVLQRVHTWISHSSGTLIFQFPPSPSPHVDPGHEL